MSTPIADDFPAIKAALDNLKKETPAETQAEPDEAKTSWWSYSTHHNYTPPDFDGA